MSHFKKVCTCGIVITQCRCMSSDKIVIVEKKPCTHNIVAVTSGAQYEPVTWHSLVSAIKKVEEQGEIPNAMRCHPSVYNGMRLYFMEEEEKRKRQWIESLADIGLTEIGLLKDYSLSWKETNPVLPFGAGSIYGCQILIDNSLEDGEWRFERLDKKDDTVRYI